jgi:transposase InsO family protein
VPTHTEPPAHEREDIILRHHMRGHFGTKATIDSIHEAGLDWPNLAAEVKEACAKCLPCQRHNIGKRGYHPLQPISADQPFDHVAIDLAGPLTTSTNKNHYLLVLVDVHSRFVCLRALPDKQSATIAAALLDIFTTLGFPKIVQSDNGSEFVNRTLKKLFDGAMIDHRLTTPYHPRANGVVERTVQTAISTIKKSIHGTQDQWDKAVPFAQYAMNTKVAAIHNSTPFAVMHGRSTNQLGNYAKVDSAPVSPTDLKRRVKFMQEALFPGVAKLARTKQQAKKSAFDATHKLINIPSGSFVMVHDNARRRKLDPRFQGPYKVVGKTGGSYTLQDNTGELLPHDFPPSALKLISDDPILDKPSHEVGAIIAHRKTRRGYRYKVRWRNYTEKDDTWEPKSSFDHEETVPSYWRRLRQPNPDTA